MTSASKKPDVFDVSDGSMARCFGYARATALRPDPKVHIEPLTEAGAHTIFLEAESPPARRTMRERRKLFAQIAPADTLILTGLEQLGTTFDDVLRCFEMLVERGVTVKIVDADFDTADTFAPAYRSILRLLAKARSALHSELVKQNLATARANGGKAAGKPAILKPEQWPDIQARIAAATLEAVAAELEVSRQTLWNYRRRMSAKEDASSRP